ncbi:HipA domain-containing protein [Rhizobium mongolense]|uniref:HipA domain-containing protein n=1 Tax=Rhizobium mongolense TaxID=57676 RepID=UPI002484AD37
MDAVIFNVLTCNSDSPAKNCSVLIGAGGTAKLAPYDLMCAAIYDRVDRHLPQNIGGSFLSADLHGKQWKAFAEETGLSPTSTVKRVGHLAAKVVKGGDPKQIVTGAGDPSRVLERIVHEVRKRCRRILRQL